MQHTTALFATLLAMLSLPACSQDTPAVVDHKEELHPAFTITAEQVKKAIQKGQQFAQKNGTLDPLFNKYRQNPQWTRGRGGRSHESYVWPLYVDGLSIVSAAFASTRKYEDLQIPEEIKANGGYLKHLTYQIVLTSVPHIARYIWERERSADEKDVKAIKFVLSDDQGHNYAATTSEGTQSSGTVTFSGSAPSTSTGSSTTIGSATASAYGSDGSSAYGTANSRYTSTWTQTQYIPWTAQRPYFQARYNVSFALFDAEGHARIKADVKQLTLHIVTESGELSTTYKL